MIRSNEQGQATVELALVFPIFIFLLVISLQVVGIVLDQLSLNHMARQMARSASVAGVDPGLVDGPARLQGKQLKTYIERHDARVTATARLQVELRMPLVDVVLLRPQLSAQSSFFSEVTRN